MFWVFWTETPSGWVARKGEEKRREEKRREEKRREEKRRGSVTKKSKTLLADEAISGRLICNANEARRGLRPSNHSAGTDSNVVRITTTSTSSFCRRSCVDRALGVLRGASRGSFSACWLIGFFFVGGSAVLKGERCGSIDSISIDSSAPIRQRLRPNLTLNLVTQVIHQRAAAGVGRAGD